jgi:tetratricopeptide (TPR) repeat protein
LYLAKIDLQQVKNDDPAIARPVSEGVIERLNTLNAQADFPAAERLNLLTTLADAYMLMGQEPANLLQLKKTYEAMLANDPNLLYALLGLGQTEHQLGNLKMALSVYQRAAAHYPTNAVVFYNLGTVYHAMGSPTQAVAAYQKALQLDDTMAEPRYGLAVIWESQHRFSDAVANYQAYVKARPDGPYAKIAQERAAALAKR